MATEDFATWFKRALTRRGWSQADFAKSAGIPHATVSAWYRGTRLPGPAVAHVTFDQSVKRWNVSVVTDT